MGADKKYSGVSNKSSDLALQLLQALRQRFPDHFKERESHLHLVDVFPGQTEEEALTMYMESHPDAMESDIYIFSWVTGVDDEDIYARGGNFTTPNLYSRLSFSSALLIAVESSRAISSEFT